MHDSSPRRRLGGLAVAALAAAPVALATGPANASPTPSPAGVQSSAATYKDATRVILAAKKWLGTPYSWGGGTINGPSEGFAQGAGIVGFDASSLVQYAVYNGMGRTSKALLPRTTTGQVNAPGKLTRGYHPEQWRRGDLLFWGSSKSNVHHVAIYVGDGMLVHAPHTGDVVKVERVWNGDFFGSLRLAVINS